MYSGAPIRPNHPFEGIGMYLLQPTVCTDNASNGAFVHSYVPYKFTPSYLPDYPQ